MASAAAITRRAERRTRLSAEPEPWNGIVWSLDRVTWQSQGNGAMRQRQAWHRREMALDVIEDAAAATVS